MKINKILIMCMLVLIILGVGFSMGIYYNSHKTQIKEVHFVDYLEIAESMNKFTYKEVFIDFDDSNRSFVKVIDVSDAPEPTELFECLNPKYPYATCDEEGCYAYDEEGKRQGKCKEIVPLSTYCESWFFGLIKNCGVLK